MNNLAVILTNQGKYKTAEQKHEQILEIIERLISSEYLETLISINNVAMALYNQGKYKMAKEMLEQILELKKKLLSPEH